MKPHQSNFMKGMGRKCELQGNDVSGIGPEWGMYTKSLSVSTLEIDGDIWSLSLAHTAYISVC